MCSMLEREAMPTLTTTTTTTAKIEVARRCHRVVLELIGHVDVTRQSDFHAMMVLERDRRRLALL
jgi:ubiquitin